MKIIIMLQAIMLLFAFGCSTPSKTHYSEQKETDVKIPGVIVSNAVITKADNKSLYYRGKCISCGFTSLKTKGSRLPEGLFTIKNKFVCPKCGQTSEVLIQRRIR